MLHLQFNFKNMEELSTEQKIIKAAKSIFTQKGFAATKTRDIAEEAGINLALLNYYFGSKENLFKLVVTDKFQDLFGVLGPVLSNAEIALEDKIEVLIEKYSQLLTENEDLPIFVLSELKNNEQIFEKILQQARNLSQPVIEKQLREKGYSVSVPDFVVNIISLAIFPFVAKPLFTSSGLIEKEKFSEFIENRKKLIPCWIATISK